jgi:hypothetical protein
MNELLSHMRIVSVLCFDDEEEEDYSAYEEFMEQVQPIIVDELNKYSLFHVVIQNFTMEGDKIVYNVVEYTHGGPVTCLQDYEKIEEAITEDVSRSAPTDSKFGLLIYHLNKKENEKEKKKSDEDKDENVKIEM